MSADKRSEWLYKGYVLSNGKSPQEKYKNISQNALKTLQEARNSGGDYAGVLAENTIMVDIDDMDQGDLLFDIVRWKKVNCRVIKTDHGYHFLFMNQKRRAKQCFTKVKLACGLTADIKVGIKACAEPLRIYGKDRPIIYDIEDDMRYDELPPYLRPVKDPGVDFWTMAAGDGRNSALYAYILTLQKQKFSEPEITEIIYFVNNHILQDPLPIEEVNTIVRPESFQKSLQEGEIFFADKTFLHDAFAQWVQENCHVYMIDNNLYVYQDGEYICDTEQIERYMIAKISGLKHTHRSETLKYLRLIAPRKQPAPARYISFLNGIYDAVEDKLLPHDPEMVILNKIPHNYNPDCYNETVDKTLNKLACDDPQIRALLEEAVGYSMYRNNKIGSFFLLTGDKSNGKSTYLEMVSAILGEKNICNLDLAEIGERFSTSLFYNKLANVGDDIADGIISGMGVSVLKKIATGNRISAEFKGQDKFEFVPYAKMFYSANDVPRIKDPTGAVRRRMVMIPLNARFSSKDPDFDPFIGEKLAQEDALEYMIALGIQGLRRVLINKKFSDSDAVEERMKEWDIENDPINAFIADQGAETIVYHDTRDVYSRYEVFADLNKLLPVGQQVLTKYLSEKLGLMVVQERRGQERLRRFQPAPGGYGYNA